MVPENLQCMLLMSPTLNQLLPTHQLIHSINCPPLLRPLTSLTPAHTTSTITTPHLTKLLYSAGIIINSNLIPSTFITRHAPSYAATPFGSTYQVPPPTTTTANYQPTLFPHPTQATCLKQ